MLDRRQDLLRVVGHRTMAEGQAAGLTGRCGEHEAVGIPDLAGGQGLAWFGQLIAGGEHRYPGPREDLGPGPAGRGEHGDLHRAEPGAPGQQYVAFACVIAAVPDRVARFHRQPDRHLGDAAVGVFYRHDGVRRGGELGPGRDPQAGAGGDRVGPGVTGCDFAGDPKRDRGVLGRPGGVRGDQCVPVHGRVVERRQRAARGDVLGQHGALGLGDAELGRRQRPDPVQDVRAMRVDADQVLGAHTVAVTHLGRHGSESRYFRSQGTNSWARSGRSDANMTRVRR